MKRKIYCLLAMMFMVLSCFYFTACGDKYEKLKFRLSYAYTQDSTNWKEIEDGKILLNYGAEGDALVFDNKNNATIYLKVEVLDVSSKDIGYITVGADQHIGLNFSSQNISNNTIVPINLNGNVDTTFTIFENNSRKQTSFDLQVRKSLQGMEVVKSLNPAVIKGKTLNLSDLNNISYIPAFPITNQVGVTYSVSNESSSLSGISINGDGVLSVSESYSGNFAKIKATSIYNKNIETEFEIAILEPMTVAPVVKYNKTSKEINNGQNLNFYYSDTNFDYASTRLNISNDYDELTIANGYKIKFENAIYVKRKNVNESYTKYKGELINKGYKGLFIENKGNDLYDVYVDSKNVCDYDIKVCVEGNIYNEQDEYVGKIDFYATQAPTNIETSFSVIRNILPTAITIDGESYSNGAVIPARDVYVNEKHFKESLVIGANSSLAALKLRTEGLRVNKTSINSGETVDVQFDGVNSGNLTISVRTTPEKFEGQDVAAQFMSVTLTFNKIVTAERISAYKTQDDVDDSTKALTKMAIAQNGVTNYYLKVEYDKEKGDLKHESIKLTSSNSNVKFGNDFNSASDNIVLDQSYKIKEIDVPGSSFDYIVYKISLVTSANPANSTIKAVAADGRVGVENGFVVMSQTCAAEPVFDMATTNSTAKEFFYEDAEEKEFFAIEKGKQTLFTVSAKENNDGVDVSEAISSVEVKSSNSNIQVLEYSPENSGQRAFSLYGIDEVKTAQDLSVKIHYFTLGANGELVSKEETRTIQVAVYNPLKSLSAEIEKGEDGKIKDTIVYVNDDFSSAKSTSITLKTKGTYTSEITFTPTEGEKKENVNTLSLVYTNPVTNASIKLNGKDDKTAKYNATQTNIVNVDLSGDGQGKIVIAYAVSVFDKTDKTFEDSKTIFVRKVDRADRVDIQKDNTENANTIVKYSNKNELHLSLFGVQDAVSGTFIANPYFKDSLLDGYIRFSDPKYLGYEIKEFEVDENGNPTKDDNGNDVLMPVSNNRFKVSVDSFGKFTISARKVDNGGLFKITVFAQDYDTIENRKQVEIIVKVTDGSQKYKHIIKTAEEFAKLPTGIENLTPNTKDAHFVLGADITFKTSTSISNFGGELSGKMNDNIFTLTYIVPQGGLFTTINQGATIKDLNLIATFNGTYTGDIGALAQTNKGTIQNVSASLFANGAIKAVNFGGLVGTNSGTINLAGASIETGKNELTINADNNIGFVAGTNSGTIIGNYNGNLNNIIYDIIPYIKATGTSIGGVAGINTGTIQNILIGGRIIAEQGALGGIAGDMSTGIIANCVAIGLDLQGESEVAGVVATASDGEIENCKFVSSQVTFTKNSLTTFGKIKGSTVAGITTSDETTISYCSVENFISNVNNVTNSTTSNFYTLDGSTVYGIAQGVCSNSFVTANIKGTTITEIAGTNVYFVGYINSVHKVLIKAGLFDSVDNEGEFNTNKANALSNCLFVKDGDYYTIENSYVDGATYYQLKSQYKEIDVDESNFAKLVKDGLYVDEAGQKTKITTETFDNSAKYYVLTLADVDGWAYDINKNIVEINGQKIVLPYLLDENGNPLMIVQPKEIIANINKDYIISIGSVYINKYDTGAPTEENLAINVNASFDIGSVYVLADSEAEFEANKYYIYNDGKYVLIENSSEFETNKDNKIQIYQINPSCTISEMVIVNYHKGNSKDDKISEAEYNTYYLNKLLNVTIHPADAQAGLTYRILDEGRNYARIENNEKIVFTDYSNNTPIIVECSSVFNPNLKQYVLIFTKPLFSELVIDGKNTVKTAENQYQTVLYTGQNATNFTISAENVYNNVAFDSLFTLSDIAQYLTIEAPESGEDLTITPLDNSIDTFAIQINKDAVEKDSSEEIEFKVYLNLKYFNLKDNAGNLIEGTVLLGTVKLKVLKVNSATGLAVKSNNIENITTHDNLEIVVDLTTGYVDNDQTDVLPESYEITSSGNVIVKTTDKDSIQFNIEVKDENKAQLDKLLEERNLENYAELFEYNITSEKTATGLQFKIQMSLKDRLIEDNIVFIVHVSALSNPIYKGSVTVTLKPSEASNVYSTTYAVEKIQSNTTYTNLISSNAVETLIVQPGGVGSIMVIKMEPTYANVISATLTSDTQFIPSLNKEVNLIFTQLVYNQETACYETLMTNNAQNGLTLNLNKISQFDENGNSIYNGLIYVHVQLEKFTGKETTLTATLEVKTGHPDNPRTDTVVTPLLTTYLPGAYLSFDGISKGENQYLVQQGSFGNEIKIKLQGYQYNANPIITFDWKNGQTESILNKITYYLDKDYHNVEYDEYDDSYTITLYFNLSKEIDKPFTFDVSLSVATKDGRLAQIDTEEEGKTLTFYPAEYLLKSVRVDRVSEGVRYLPVGNSDIFDLEFTLFDGKTKDSDTIYDKLMKSGVNLLDCVSFMKNGISYKMSDVNSHPEFNAVVKSNKLIITGISSFNGEINVNIPYYYDYSDGNGVYELKFGSNTTGDIVKPAGLQYTFRLQIYEGNTEENAQPIRTISDMFNADGTCALDEKGHYILMNDLDLSELKDESGNIVGIKPIDKIIGSLDGNNKVIKIAKFATSPEITNYGLFAQIGTYQDEAKNTYQTILKNVMVDYSNFEDILSLPEGKNVFGGLVANNNGGLIYNCDVINTSTAHKAVRISVKPEVGSGLVFGGLVGKNTGIITNSRVGRSSYKQIEVTSNYERAYEIDLGSLEFNISNYSTGDNVAHTYEIVAGGFVGQNNKGNGEDSGIIATSYVANTSLITSSTSEEKTNKTAGFVGENTGRISYSYVKKLEEDIDKTVKTGNIKIENTGKGIIAGFAYTNSGSIDNSYSNTELYTNSAYISGFVYNNTGSISTCYAACMMNSNIEGGFAEQPVIGVTSGGDLLSTNDLENVYYLIRDNKAQAKTDKAIAMNEKNFANSDNLTGFVFVLTDTQAERAQGIWSYTSLDGTKHKLPDLINANTIAHSYRYIVSEKDGDFKYTNAAEFAPGSANNPHIIKNVNDFNNLLDPLRQTGLGADTLSRASSNTGYYRLVNNIDFNDNETAIRTRINYTFGNSEDTSNAETSFDGNGMTISGIYFDVGKTEVDSIGLFAKIKNAYIKNVNLEFANPKKGNQYSTTEAQYSGGLAGKIEDSVIVNVKLNGASATLTGKNFVGGLAGYIGGRSLIYGIETNLSVKTSLLDVVDEFIYYNRKDYKGLKDYDRYLKENVSYAGGVAGVIDVTTRNKNGYNLSYIKVRGDEMSQKLSNNIPEANIMAVVSGGVAGYVNENVSAYKLKYYMGTTDYILGSKVVGGLFGISLGSVLASQVTAEEETQFADYDSVFSTYIKDLDNNEIKDLSEYTTEYNYNFLESYGYTGGLIGVALGGSIDSVYSRASIKDGVTVGGLVGLSYANLIKYSYAVPYINVTSRMQQVGGLYGAAYHISKTAPAVGGELKSFEEIVKSKTKQEEKTTDIQYTFSTIITNTKQFADEEYRNEISKANIDYVGAYANNKATSYLSVYAGVVGNYDTKIKNANSGVERVELVELYDIEHKNHIATFKEAFDWSINKHWSLDSNKYFPLLIDKEPDNYYEIDEPTDFDYMIANPDLDYKIIEHIDLSEWLRSKPSNWVFNVNFTGTLFGAVGEENDAAIISGLSRATTTGNNSAGLFRSTYGASIENVNFVWNGVADGTNSALNIANDGITQVGGLTCEDTGSTFKNVIVQVAPHKDNTQKDTFNFISGNAIDNFGGLVGKGTNTVIESCFFDCANINAKLDGDNGGESAFGGLVGYAEQGISLSEEENEAYEEEGLNTNFSIIKSQVGSGVYISDEFTTNDKNIFTITSTAQNSTYVGGAVGYISKGSINNTQVGVKKSVQITATAESGNLAVAGLIGYNNQTDVAKSKAQTTIDVTSKNSSTGVVYAAGAIGVVTTDTLVLADAVEISEVHSQSIIKVLKDSTFAHLYAAGGIAHFVGAVKVTESVYDGEIVCEQDDNSIKITNVYAGGAVGSDLQSSDDTTFVDKGILIIDQVFANVAMTIGSSTTQTVHAGGLVGRADIAVISNSVAGGKIVPITTENAYKETIIGGLLGYSATTVTGQGVSDTNNSDIKNSDIARSYTLSSIITDGLSKVAIKKLHAKDDANNISTINAVVGFAPSSEPVALDATDSDDELKTVFYSSDINLTADERGFGKNLSAYAFVKDSAWHEQFVGDSNLWKETTEHALLYQLNLESQLVAYNILKSTDAGTYQFTEGLAYNPTLIDNDGYNFNSDKFTYYLLSTSIEEIESSKLVGELNGVLVGGNAEYKTTGTIFVTIPKHSAVSNLHIKLEDKSTFTNKAVIVETNNGMLFNASVQGHELTMSASEVGLIAHKNTGLISHAYSTAEVINCNSAGGIVHQNNGRIMSSFFTGYIATGDGIACEMDENPANVVVYNSYMAGVVVENSASTKSFALANSEYLSNSFIDSMLTDRNEAGDIGKSTASLMAAAELKGNWHTTVSDSKFKLAEGESLNIGYNYCYPVFNFNKISIEKSGAGSEIKEINRDIEFGYYEKTGTGENAADANKERKDYLIDGTSYDNAFKIPHLGVLSAVHGLLGTSRDYVIIYDINGAKTNEETQEIKYKVWTAIGSANRPAGATTADPDPVNGFAYTGGFNGVIISNRYFNHTSASASGDDDVVTASEGGTTVDPIVTISGLSGNGLFANINIAYISDINFAGTFNNLSNSGAIGTNVTGTTIIENISFLMDEENQTSIVGAEQSGDNNNYYGALFGQVAGDLSIINLNTSAVDTEQSSEGTTEYKSSIVISPQETEPYNSDTEKYSAAGLIAGQMTTGGTVTIDENSKLYIKFADVQIAGGLIGEMTDGTLGGANEITVHIQQESSASLFGGLAGIISAGTIQNIKLYFTDDATVAKYNFNSFGGLVGLAKGGEIENCVIDYNKDLTINHTVSSNEDLESDIAHFGMVAAKVTDGSLTVKGFKLAQEETTPQVIYKGDKTEQDHQAVGFLVGYLKGTITINEGGDEDNFVLSDSVKLDTDILNMGGVAGYYAEGTVNVGAGLGKVTLCGIGNVGGLFGTSQGHLFDGNGKSIFGDSSKEIAVEVANVEINKGVSSFNDDKYSNFGGMFGVLNTYFEFNGNPEGTENQEDKEKTLEDLPTITGGGNIKFGLATKTDGDCMVQNVGGIAGKFIGKYAVNITNKTSIQLNNLQLMQQGSEGTNKYSAINGGNYKSGTDVSSFINAVNVGGIFGTVEAPKEEPKDDTTSGDGTGEGEEAVQPTAEGESTPADDTTLITLYNLRNQGDNNTQISGYQNVGGLVGSLQGSEKCKILMISENIIQEDGNGKFVNKVDGGEYPKAYIDGVELTTAPSVGGEGAEGTPSLTAETEDDVLKPVTNATVIGALNVGGVVGCVSGQVTIQNMYTTASVYGNTNVGGFVGYLAGDSVETTIANNWVDTVTVSGIYYTDVSYKSNGTNNTTPEYKYAIPGNVGGFVGNAEQGEIKYNQTHSITISSTEEGVEVNNGNASTISTISNYMLDAGNGGSAYANRDMFNSDDKEMFEEITTGFGGFAGKINYDNAMALENGATIETNRMYELTIDAPLGVNVGTYYGYYLAGDQMNETTESGAEPAAESSGNEKYLAVPMLSGSQITVDGGYNIGGLVGAIASDGSVHNISNTSITNGKASITLGSNRVGMYIGGLVGKLDCNSATGWNIQAGTDKVNITINTSQSYYMGGLVGKLYITQSNNFNGSVGRWKDANGIDLGIEHVDKDNITTSDRIGDTNSAVTFGGLVGMVKSASYNGSGITILVEGSHKYPFTVNTVENGNYSDENGLFDSAIDDYSGEIILTAMATYKNKDQIKIMGSKDTTWYDGKKNGATDYNPTRGANSGTWGWSKEYTGFKTLQRCIPQSLNNGASWDSIGVVYDAVNITNVGTVDNLGLTSTDYTSNTDIVYTVYEEEENYPTLYSSMGIATILMDGDEKTDVETGDTYVDIKYVDPEEDIPSFMENLGGFLLGNEPPAVYYINASDTGKNTNDSKPENNYYNKDINDLKGFGYNTYYRRINGGNCTYNSPERDGDKYAAYVVYQVNNYLPDDTGRTNAWFQFRNIFTTQSDSGSLFKVNGSTRVGSYGSNFPTEKTTRFEIWSYVIMFVIDLVITFFTCGSWAGFKAMGTFLKSCAKNFFKGLLTKALWKKIFKNFLRLAVVKLVIGDIFQSQATAANYAKEVYLAQVDRPIGFTSSAYSRPIDYTSQNGSLKVDSSIEHAIMKNGHPYTYHSTVRPNDYYSDYWTCLTFTVEENKVSEYINGNNSNSEGTFVTCPQNTSFNKSVDDQSNIMFYKEGKAYLKMAETYVYHEGAYYATAYAPVETVKVNNLFVKLQTFGINNEGGTDQYLVSDNHKTFHSIKTNGNNYVYGYFDGSDYYIGLDKINSDYPTNLTTFKDSQYINKLTGEEIKNSNTPIPGTSNNIGFTYARLSYRDLSERLKGYEYFDSLYYAPTGNANMGVTKYAQYIKINSLPNGASLDNINYLYIPTHTTTETDDVTGETYSVDHYAYYQYDGVSANTDAYDYNSPIAVGDNKDIISVKVYPYSIQDPITLEDKVGIKDGENECVYIWQDENDSGLTAEDKQKLITLYPTFFIYEGGYHYTKGVNEKTDGIYTIVDPARYNDLFVIENSAYSNNDYNPDNGDVKKYIDLSKDSSKRGTYVMNYPNSTTHYSLYIDENGYIYQWSEGKYDIKEGSLVRQYPKTRSQTVEDFNYNKYLTNPTYGLYTRFKYNTNLAGFTDGGVNYDDPLNENLDGLWYKIHPKSAKNSKDEDNEKFTQYRISSTSYRLIPRDGSYTSGMRFTEKVQVLTAGKITVS